MGEKQTNHAWPHLEQMFRDYMAGRPVKHPGHTDLQGKHVATRTHENSNVWIHRESAGE